MQYPCRVCKLPCENFPDKEASILCNTCQQWVHFGCTKLTWPQFKKLGNSVDSYYCVSCIGESLPFSGVSKMNIESSTLSRNMKKIMNISKTCSLCIECNDECDACEKSCPDLYKVCDSCLLCEYCNPEELDSIFIERKSSQLGLLHLNASSLTLEENFENISSLIKSFKNKPDILCVTETRIKDPSDIDNVNLSGYHPPISNESTSQAGGSCVYVKSDITFKERIDLNFNIGAETEATFIEIESTSKLQKNTIIGCIYRHPHDNHEMFFDYFINTIEKVNKTCNLIIMGDINIDTLHKTENHAVHYKNTLLSLGLRNTINKATRITTTSETSLDHILTNLNYSSITSGILQTDVSDHLPLYAIANLKVEKKHLCTQYSRRFYSVSKASNFTDTLVSNLNKTEFLDAEHPNVRLNRLVQVLQESNDEVFPLKRLSRKKQKQFRNPWITPLLVKSTQKCKELFRIFLKKKDEESHIAYKKYRNTLNTAIKNAKEMHEYEDFKTVEKDIEKTWKLINKKSGRLSHKNINKFPKAIKNAQGNLVSNPTAIANCLNKHFVEKATDLANEIRISNNIHPNSYLSPRNQVAFKFRRFTIDEVYKIIIALCTHKSTGYDGIPACIIKWSAAILAPLLTNIFNDFVKIGEYPSICKTASVTALPKKGDPMNQDNYRSISVLTQLNKVFEKLLHGRMVNFIEENNILCKTQFGFRKGHSTSHAITCLNEKLIENIEKQKVSYVLFMDLKSAFDTVNHKILLEKLEHIGFRGCFLNLLSSYLTGRKQYVKNEDIESLLLDVVCGVPQGSVLGPLLFILYINDIVNCSGFDSVLYADDAALVISADTIKKLKKRVNSELPKVHDWLSVNKLTLNCSKTKYMLFGFDRFTKNKSTSKLKFRCNINKRAIERVDEFKYLGVIIDNKLNWQKHVDYIASKLAKIAGVIYKLRTKAQSSTLTLIYNSLAGSYLSYGILAWGNCASSTLIKLQSLQNKILRYMTFTDSFTSIKPAYKNKKVLNVENVSFFEAAKFMWAIHNNSIPDAFKDYFIPLSHSYSTRTKNKANYTVPRPRTNLGKCSIKYQGIIVWGKIPHELQNLDKSTQFKSQLKEHIIENNS